MFISSPFNILRFAARSQKWPALENVPMHTYSVMSEWACVRLPWWSCFLPYFFLSGGFSPLHAGNYGLYYCWFIDFYQFCLKYFDTVLCKNKWIGPRRESIQMVCTTVVSTWETEKGCRGWGDGWGETNSYQKDGRGFPLMMFSLQWWTLTGCYWQTVTITVSCFVSVEKSVWGLLALPFDPSHSWTGVLSNGCTIRTSTLVSLYSKRNYNTE